MYVGPRYRVRATSGIFIYGPRPTFHSRYYVGDQRPVESVQVRASDLPRRTLNRKGSLAVGLKAGSYFGAYNGANAFGDVGVGLQARYRPMEAVGLEVAAQHHNDEERIHTTAAASVNLFAFPWSRVSPYALGGVTYTNRQIEDQIWLDQQVQTVSANGALYGPHIGAGVELSVGKKLAFDLEARYVNYVNQVADDPTAGGALQTSASVLYHF